MEVLSPSRRLEKSPFKDITNSTPTPFMGAASPRKFTKSSSRTKRSNSNSVTNTTTTPPQRRSTRLSSLKSENIPEELPQSGITTRSRRKVTPSGGGSVSIRKRSGKREPQEESVSSGRRKRRSVSALPSSPLAGKNSPHQILTTPNNRPRMTRSSSMSAKTETSEIVPHKITISVINESEMEATQGNASPLENYINSRTTQITAFVETPFKQYPLPISPIKSFSLHPSTGTPINRKSPIAYLSSLKPLLGENDIFAISPGMFPRKMKTLDYLDILADSERNAFTSPIKTVSENLVVPSRETLISEQDEVAIPIKPILEDIDIEIKKTEDVEKVEESKDATDEEHPHFALLGYLADMASVRDCIPEGSNPVEEFTQESVEDILTAAALAESLKEEIFIISDSHQQVDEIQVEDEDVEIMMIHEEAATENVEVAEGQDEKTSDEPQPSAKFFGAASQTSPQGSVHQQISLEYNSAIIESVNFLDNATASTIPENVFPSEKNDDQDDWESLISFSEAEDTVASRLDEQTHDMQIPLEQSLNNNVLVANKEIRTENEVCSQPNENFTSNDTIGVNEMGECVAREIKMFEDAVTEDVLPVQNEPRLSLDSTVIFSLPAEQALVTSPPKRQISLNEKSNFAAKKRKTVPILPNPTRLDMLRKRATRVRSREARRNVKRRDFATALQPILDNLPSPVPKKAILKNTAAILPPSFLEKRLQSPVTPAPTKRCRIDGKNTPLGKSPSPLKHGSVQMEAVLQGKHFVIHSSPSNEAPKLGFQFVFESKSRSEKAVVVESVVKPTPRYEVYSKIFGPPPQLQSRLAEKETTSVKPDTNIDTGTHRFKSPSRKRKDLETDPQIASKKAPSSEVETPQLSALGRPVRNESFAVPAIPIPPGPPQLPPSIQRNNNKRFTSRNTSVLPSPAQPPPSVARSALPRPAGGLGSALPVPATRRSTRSANPGKIPPAGVKSAANPGTTSIAAQNIQSALEKKPLLNGFDAHLVNEKIVAPAAVPDIPHPENVTMERPKGKLGGAQRVNRNGDNKKIEVPTRPTRPVTPPLTSLSQKELKSLTDANTKKNEGFKTVNLQPTVKRINKKRPPEPSDEFMVGKGAKWSKSEAIPDWDRDITEEDGKAIKWKSPQFMTKPERRGAMRVKGILKKKEREKTEKDEESVASSCEPLIIQRVVYKGEK